MAAWEFKADDKQASEGWTPKAAHWQTVETELDEVQSAKG